MKNDGLIKAMDAFGGGLGASGEVCGAVIGGLAVIGLLYGRSGEGRQADIRMWKDCRVFMKRFKNEVADGNILCRDLIGVDWTDIDQAGRYRQSDQFEYCLRLTGKTAKLAGEMIDKARTG
jgi:C_GCAxxG_C_C family probable redox protein